MRRRTAALIVAAGTLGAVAVGSGITAWADWSVEMTNGRGSLRAAALPTVAQPRAEVNAKMKAAGPRVDWTAVKLASGHSVGGYLVVRHTGDTRAEACRVPASKLTCVDSEATPGSSVTYTVQALAGTRWTGPASPASEPVRVPGKPSGVTEKTSASGTAASASGTAAEDGTGNAGAGSEQGADAETGSRKSTATPSVTPVPSPWSSAPASGTGSEPAGGSPAQTVTSGEESGAGTSG
ncbi:hypothetical protein AB0G04_02875 [Actinoplanes sp. NPDC023801]|uniref:hypothetical protein n=1 Tax=Actinoplanes sp. NPDC023801 TaxID=3154595 RepID=UPI003408299C